MGHRMRISPCGAALVVLVAGCPEGRTPDPGASELGVGVPDGAPVDHRTETALDQQPPPDQAVEGDAPQSLASFGGTCNLQTIACKPGYECFTTEPDAGTGVGFCTKPCAPQLSVCSDAPPDTHALCAVQAPDSTLRCGFVCGVQPAGGALQEYSCPGGMTCAAQGVAGPDGTTYYTCDP